MYSALLCVLDALSAVFVVFFCLHFDFFSCEFTVFLLPYLPYFLSPPLLNPPTATPPRPPSGALADLAAPVADTQLQKTLRGQASVGGIRFHSFCQAPVVEFFNLFILSIFSCPISPPAKPPTHDTPPRPPSGALADF